MRFWDSSALVPLLVQEPATSRIELLYDEDPLVLTWWATEVECASALARRERAGVTGDGIAEANARLSELVSRWQEVEPVSAVRRAARRLVRVHDLRAGDALQLAAAVVAAEGRPAAPDFVTLDERLAHAAEREGFPILP